MQNNNAKFKKDDLKKRAYILALDVIKALGALKYNDAAGQIIAKQLLRSATSIGANIVEAQAGSTRKDFTNFINHALKSANESKFWLALLRDSHKVDRAQVDHLLQETAEVANILAASILTLKGKR